MSMHIPSFEDVLSRLGLPPDALRHPYVKIPSVLFRLLVSEVVRRQPFDEAVYLANCPDVAQALKAGVIDTAHEHYVTNGYFEGRIATPSSVDEPWYLRNNPDVAQAVRGGAIKSGAAHYDAAGRREGRAANAAASAAKAVWDTALNHR